MLTTLLTAGLLVSVLRSSRGAAVGAEPHVDRRRVHRSNRDPREALALVGNALAATHDARALTPLILEVITEATGARGGQLVQGGVEIGWFGDVGGAHPLELDLTTDEHEGRTALLLYPPRRGFGRCPDKKSASQQGDAVPRARKLTRLTDCTDRSARAPPPT